jgi:hypothetical protein
MKDISCNRKIQKIELCICNCFLRCTEHCYEDTLLLIEMKVVDSLLNIIEMYVDEIENRKILLNEKTVESISIIFFNMGLKGSKAGSKKEKNKFKKYFDESSRLNILLSLFEYLIWHNLSPIQKNTINFISIAICLLLKNEKPPPSYNYVIKYVKNLKSSPSPTSSYDFPSFAKDSWDEILKDDECVLNNNYQFEEIIVPENFKVKNGMLGLYRDV